MERKKYIPIVKAVQTIPGVVEEGGIYKLNELNRLFPYIDFENKDYFQKVYSDDKFKNGDRVRYVGKGNDRPLGISSETTYVVTGVSHKTIGEYLHTAYTVKHMESGSTWLVKESELDYAKSKWIVSFSNDKSQERPAIHEIDYFAYKNNIEKTWKDRFVFDTREDAKKLSDFLSKYDWGTIIGRTTCFELHNEPQTHRIPNFDPRLK